METKRTTSAPAAALGVAGCSLALVAAYLLALLAAAAWRRPPPPARRGGLRFVVLVPAHDEERVIARTLASLASLDYPHDLVETIVVADNCSDRTAAAARDAGVTVWERHDTTKRGKGHALAWALERLWAERPAVDAVVVVDADCEASPNLLAAFDSRLEDGAAAVQADYVVANPEESPAAALRWAAFALVNTVRPRGKSALGLSCGLLGTGMGFRTDVLRRLGWRAHGLAEDLEQHLRLVAAGERAEFVAEASVRSPMPTTFAGAHEQQARWESGKWQAARAWTPRLLAAGVARRDPVRVHAALEPLVPPQSVLLAAAAAVTIAAGAARADTARRLAAAALAGQVVFVLGGLRLVGAPRAVYGALAQAPRLVAAKLGVYARLAGGRGPTAWVRTARS